MWRVAELEYFTLFIPTDIRVTSLVCPEDVVSSASVVLEYAEFYSSDCFRLVLVTSRVVTGVRVCVIGKT